MIDALHPEDAKVVWAQTAARLGLDQEEPLPDGTPEDMHERILKAIKAGLESKDAQMVRAAMDWQTDHAGREYLRELTVNITPYQIADKSLRNIVLEAGVDVIKEIEAALVERASRKVKVKRGNIDSAPQLQEEEPRAGRNR